MIKCKNNDLKAIRPRAVSTLVGLERLPTLLATSILATAMAGCGGGSSPASDPSIAATADGAVQGTVANDVIAFKGIPFAAPPVGPLRWRPPQPVAAWSGVRQATSFVHDCMQVNSPYSGLTVTPSEDCLYLNVWRPLNSTGAKLPVMVWIYGGAYVVGGTSPLGSDGTQFAKRGVVLVTLNYRLGRFGFFAHPALTAAGAQSGEPLANYGYMDQIAALKWVQRNIANFGGDPGNVTVFGESAGGESIHNLLTSPMATGLFAKAIVESGNGRVDQYYGRTLTRNAATVGASAEEQGTTFAGEFGINGSDANALAALRALSADQVLDSLDGSSLNAPHSLATFSGGPIIDGKLVVDEPENQYKNGQFSKVPLMLGVNDADLGFSTPGITTKDQAYAILVLRTRLRPRRHSTRQAQPPLRRWKARFRALSRWTSPRASSPGRSRRKAHPPIFTAFRMWPMRYVVRSAARRMVPRFPLFLTTSLRPTRAPLRAATNRWRKT